MNLRARIVGAAAAIVLLVAVGAAAMARNRSAHAIQPIATPIVASANASVATRHIAIKVSGMFCENCEATVRTMLTRTAGVRSAVVNVARGSAAVDYDPNVTTPLKLADVINRLGYKATLPAAE